MSAVVSFLLILARRLDQAKRNPRKPEPEEEAEDAVVCEHEDTAVRGAAAQAVRTSARRATTMRRIAGAYPRMKHVLEPSHAAPTGTARR